MKTAAYWQLLGASLAQGGALRQPLRSGLATVCLEQWRRCLGACSTPDTVEAIQHVLITAVATAADPAAIKLDMLVELLDLWCACVLAA